MKCYISTKGTIAVCPAITKVFYKSPKTKEESQNKMFMYVVKENSENARKK